MGEFINQMLPKKAQIISIASKVKLNFLPNLLVVVKSLCAYKVGFSFSAPFPLKWYPFIYLQRTEERKKIKTS